MGKGKELASRYPKSCLEYRQVVCTGTVVLEDLPHGKLLKKTKRPTGV